MSLEFQIGVQDLASRQLKDAKGLWDSRPSDNTVKQDSGRWGLVQVEESTIRRETQWVQEIDSTEERKVK